jgi:hypothetical protein
MTATCIAERSLTASRPVRFRQTPVKPPGDIVPLGFSMPGTHPGGTGYSARSARPCLNRTPPSVALTGEKRVLLFFFFRAESPSGSFSEIAARPLSAFCTILHGLPALQFFTAAATGPILAALQLFDWAESVPILSASQPFAWRLSALGLQRRQGTRKVSRIRRERDRLTQGSHVTPRLHRHTSSLGVCRAAARPCAR